MQVNHIGLNISCEGEVSAFYLDILELQANGSFTISRQISQKFFDIPDDTRVFMVKNEQASLELFVYGKPLKTGYAHMCIEVEDREETARRCHEKGYPVMRLKREKGDLLFVKDKIGNVFELKNKVL